MTSPAPNENELSFLHLCRVTDEAAFINACSIYADFLYQTNETFNLTRIPPEEFWSKHVCDSLSVVMVLPELRGKHLKVCDLGCGAGLPSLILAAAFPNLLITAIDSRGKKVEFVQQAAERMNLKNLRAFHARANEFGRTAEHKHRYDLVTARAVADAGTLIRESRDLLNGSGRLVIYRTMSQAMPEIQQFQLKKEKLSYQLSEEFSLPGDAGKRLFLMLFR